MAKYTNGVDDLVLLTELSEKEITETLAKRFANGIIYTYIGPVLLAVNPYEKLANVPMKQYTNKFQHENPPHIYALSEDTFRNMKNDRESQCVIISGESGAGKTVSAKLVMAYIAAASGNSEGVDYVKQVILSSNPLLEAFGNAKTIRNDNSSRFGKYFEIQFNKRSDPCCGRITNYLLEKSRVVGQTDGERNFHIFYQLVYGAPSELLTSLQLYEPKYFHYLNQTSCVKVDTVNDKEDFVLTCEAMRVMGITDDIKENIFELIAGILHLGNVNFVENQKGYAGVDENSLEELDLAARFLRVDPTVLKNAMLFRVVEVQSKRGSTYNSPQNVEQAGSARDSLSKTIYSRLFDWLVGKVNEALSKGGESTELVIGILDIFGFEIFQWNGFEQFCINFVNEKLQQYFIELTLKAEQDEYAEEGIKWTPIKYFNNQVVCDLIEGKKPPGIFQLLDDICSTAHAVSSQEADGKFLQKMGGGCQGNRYWRGFNTAFAIQHYAGEVTYECAGFTEKNKDTLFKDLIETVQSSEMAYLASLFPEDVSSSSNKRPTTAGFKMRTSAAELMKALSSCTPHYVRCIKPNDQKKPRELDKDRVIHQVKYLGLLENVRVRRAGFAYRAPFARFVKRYKKLSPKTWGLWGEWNGDPIQGCETILSDVGISKDAYQMGKTKCFLRSPETLFFLEESLERFQHDCCTRIQKAWRNFQLKKKAIEERAKAADLFRGKKERRRDSAQQKFTADYMGYSENYGLQEAIKQGGGGTEIMVYANQTVKFNRRLKPEKRDFVVTNKATYFGMRKKKGNDILYKLTKRAEHSCITGISLSTLQDSFFIIHMNDYDVVCMDDRKTEIVTKIIGYSRDEYQKTINLTFSDSITYKIKTGDTRSVFFQSNPSHSTTNFTKKGKNIHVSIAPGLDRNTDTTPLSWTKQLQQQSSQNRSGVQVKSHFKKVVEENDEDLTSDKVSSNLIVPQWNKGGGGETPVKQNPVKQTGVKGPQKGGIVKGPQKGPIKQQGGETPVKQNPVKQTGVKGPQKGPMKQQGGGGETQKVPMKQPQKVPQKQPQKQPQKPQFNGPRAQALYDYESSAQDELSFTKDTIINILQQDPSGWWEGEIDGRKGWCPATYLQLI